MKPDNIGRDIPLKEAFLRHWLNGVAEIAPVTRELEAFKQRAPHLQTLVCAERMVDDVAKMLDKYHQSAKDADSGIHSPFPVMLVAFANHQPIASDKGVAVANPCTVRLGGQWYKMRTDFVERRVQIAFFAHTGETARAMTSQMRLYWLRFNQQRFAVQWRFGGHEFDLTASAQDIPVTDDLADLPDRSNLTVLLWNMTLQYQMPYVSAPEPARYDATGKRAGYPEIQRVDMYIKHHASGAVATDDTSEVPPQGKWTEKP